MWKSITNFASAAADAAVEAAKQTKASVEKGVNELVSPPTNVRCGQCAQLVPVPPTIWDWKCARQDCKTTNPKDATVCSICKTSKPSLPNPTVNCGRCNIPVDVPSSGAKLLLSEAKYTVVSAGTMAKKEIEALGSKPETFHCEHCNTLLAVPAAVPWNCPSCKSANAADSFSCGGCAQKRPDGGQLLVMCGACNRPTTVPSIKLLVDLKATYNDANRQLFKVYYDVSKTPYVNCPRCSTPCPLPERKIDKPADVKQGSVEEKKSLLSTTDEQKEGAPAPEKAGVGSAPPPVAAPPAGNSVEVVCSKCADKLLVQLPN